ncbi:OmpA family protein [Aestuariispira ectoiniformans]|uniref:OmpA family protein n=1 Tax=Aestuariispira ectoiniformans TaxID=2775080 RepID=UPI00223BDD57|nr:OmpA family protein [Aestuariispira ectoiniformans]
MAGTGVALCAGLILMNSGALAQTKYYTGTATYDDSVTVDLQALEKLGSPPNLPQLLRPATPSTARPSARPQPAPSASGPVSSMTAPSDGPPVSSLLTPGGTPTQQPAATAPRPAPSKPKAAAPAAQPAAPVKSESKQAQKAAPLPAKEEPAVAETKPAPAEQPKETPKPAVTAEADKTPAEPVKDMADKKVADEAPAAKPEPTPMPDEDTVKDQIDTPTASAQSDENAVPEPEEKAVTMAEPEAPAPEPAAQPEIQPEATTAPEATAQPEEPEEDVAMIDPDAVIMGDDRTTIKFPEGVSDLPKGVRGALDKIAKDMDANQDQRLQLLGYAVTPGESPSQARRISLFRALSVRTYLMKQGVRSTRMDVRALGDKIEGGPPNRVDIVIPN